MKILVLYRYSRTNSFNHWGNLDFYKDLNEFPNIDVRIYGVDVEQICPSLVLTQFDSKLYMKDLYEKYNFDIIIVAGKNRTCYTSIEEKSWLPLDFATYPCYKILIEPDFHKYREDDWFFQNNIGAILHRHNSNVIRAEEYLPEINHYWFPYSVDTDIFKPSNKKRSNEICFVGNNRAKAYQFRKQAINLLKENNLLNFQGIKLETDYLDVLQDYTVFLNGASIYNIDNMKAFEILASGGVLFTNNAQNEFKTLFKNAYITYKNDFSDIIKIATKLLNKPQLQEKLSKKGRDIICKKHTHQIRCKELLEIIKSELRIHKHDFDYTENEIINKEIDTPIEDITIPNTLESVINKEKVDIDESNSKYLDESTQLNIDLLKLQEANIKICLLKRTCYEKVIGSSLTYPLYLGVSDINKAKTILTDNVIFDKFPSKTKNTKINDMIVQIPLPVIKYLTDLNYKL